MDKKLRKVIKKQNRREFKAKKKHGVGYGAVVGENQGVTGWRVNNWYRPDSEKDKAETVKRRQAWEEKQAIQYPKPIIKRRPKTDNS